jgi:hypothetical protein
MTTRSVADDWAEAAKTGLEPANTASGPVRRHAGLWRKRNDEWCAVVANEHDPKSGEYVVIKRRDGARREKLLCEKLESRDQTSVWSVMDYDSRYDDFDLDDADPMGPY